MSQAIDWSRRGTSPLFSLAGYAAWLASAIAFAVGIVMLIGADSVETQTFVALCILIAQALSLRTFVRERSYRALFILGALLGWSLAFVSNSAGLIGHDLYAVFIAAFVCSVIFIRSRR